MKCWVCKRQARGFRHADTRLGVSDPRSYPVDWVFCSQRCQDIFHTMYGNWQRVLDGRINLKEVAMIDPTDIELASMRKCLKAFGEAAGEIGFNKPLGDYAEREALQVIDAIVTCWTDAMQEHHQQSKYPPVRGMPSTPDPMAHSLVDMKDDLPWDTEKPKQGKPGRVK